MQMNVYFYHSFAFGAIRAGSDKIKGNVIQYERHSSLDNRFAYVRVVLTESLPNSFTNNRTIRSRSRP